MHYSTIFFNSVSTFSGACKLYFLSHTGVINVFRARALLYKYGMANYKISVINNKHRYYRRGKIPRDLIPQYLEADGVHLKDLIDERDHDYDKFGTWEQWEDAFMHKKDLCTGPIKFPIWRHYRH